MTDVEVIALIVALGGGGGIAALIRELRGFRTSNDAGHDALRTEIRELSKAQTATTATVADLDRESSGSRTDLDQLMVTDTRRHEENVRRLDNLDERVAAIEPKGDE